MTRLSLRLFALAALTAFAWNAQASVAQDAGAGLEGSAWRLVSIGHNPIESGKPTIKLGADGAVAGSTGCNMMKATYTTEGANLQFGPIGTTRKYCAAVWETEHAFLAMLDKVRGYTLADGTLVLTGGNGEALATFRAE